MKKRTFGLIALFLLTLAAVFYDSLHTTVIRFQPPAARDGVMP